MLLRVRGTKFWIFQSHSHCLSSFSLSILTGLRRVARDMDNDDNRERIEACIQKEARKLLIICRNSDHSKRIRPTGNIMHRALLWPSSSGGMHDPNLCCTRNLCRRLSGHGWERGCSHDGYVGYVGEVGGRNVDVLSLAHMLDATKHHGYVKGLCGFSGSSESKTCGALFATHLSRCPGFEPVLVCLARCSMTLTTCAIHATLLTCHRYKLVPRQDR